MKKEICVYKSSGELPEPFFLKLQPPQNQKLAFLIWFLSVFSNPISAFTFPSHTREQKNRFGDSIMHE
jgi:hypothetical protein